MRRGRKRDDPKDQAAKGFPGRRKSKTIAALARMERQAERDAQLFVDASNGADLLALPVFLADKRLAAAQTIWKEYAPKLDRLHLLTTLDRYTFAMFCIYAAEFVLANKDVLDTGYTIMVTTVAGAKSKAKQGAQMPRKNPSVDRRDYAADMMLSLAEKFGFTPLERHKLIQMHAMHPDDETLFGRSRAPQLATPQQQQAAASPPEQTSDIVGSLSTLDSVPPGSRPN